ncbi:MAG: hypothetical protein Q8R47_05840 [Nanoarchaeota archaeon]|nr:hypothetical protein [Nanoarchaeota archaeon]
MKLSIAGGGASYDPNSNYSPLEPASTENERIALPSLIMVPVEPKISYKHHSIPYISLDYLPAEEE